MTNPRPQYMTIDAFRRDFFAPGSRPTRASVRNWIDEGKLPAIKLDGRVYVRQDHAEAFIAGARIEDHAVERAKESMRAWNERQEAAKRTLREFGFKI